MSFEHVGSQISRVSALATKKKLGHDKPVAQSSVLSQAPPVVTAPSPAIRAHAPASQLPR
jgi:hypothetical protein